MKARLATVDDHDLLKQIVMHPDVRQCNELEGEPREFQPEKYTGADGNSFSVVIEDKLGPVGCFTAFAIEQASYLIHTSLSNTCRGVSACAASHAALDFAFTRTDAEHLWTMVPLCKPHVLRFSRHMGFRDTFLRPDAWQEHGVKCDVQHMRMDIDDWTQRAFLAPLGERFHGVLVEKGGHVNHISDPMHDAYVGAAWAMTMGGQLHKGMRIYGRWARACGYQPYRILSVDPLRINIGNAVLRAENNDFIVEEPEHA